MNTIGIDAGSKELVVVIMVKGKARKAKTFENTSLGHQSVINSLTKLKGGIKGLYKSNRCLSF